MSSSDSAGPGVGFKYPVREVSWLKRDVLLFANTVGCKADELHFLYELHPKFTVFPTYPVILPFKFTDSEVIDFYARSAAVPIPGVPKFDSKRVVDGQRKLTFHKQLPVSSTGRKFEVRQSVVGVYDKGKAGSVLETKTELVDAQSGETYTTMVGSGFFVGQGGWGGPKGPATLNYPPPSTAPSATATVRLTNESALLYRLNGDYNPLHATPEPGQKMGFGGAIMHGLFSFNSSAHELLRELGGSDPANIKEYQARFAAPVKPGDVLVTEMWRMGNADEGGFEEVRFTVKIEGGKVVLSNGRAVVKCVGKTGQSKL